MSDYLFGPAPISAETLERVRAFVEKWQGRTGSEEANFQPFFSELCAAIGVEPPGLKTDGEDEYCYEKPVRMVLPGGRGKTGKIDAFKRGCFVFEAKMAGESANKRGTGSHRKYMKKAFNQAIDYARALPEKPPFVITCDVGGNFEIWQGFSESWVGTFADYGDYESRRRVPIADLAKPETIALFVDIFENPQNRNPERIAALVTRAAAEPLADLARQLEGQHGQARAGDIAEFLMRCIFTMFAEDVALLRSGIFTDFLEKCVDAPGQFKPGIESFWRLMDTGGEMPMEGAILHFNGKLFEDAIAFDLTSEQIETLLDAARKDWRRVEPAIFGTLLERAVDTRERKKLGAHYTPRAYVERLVNPVVMEPLAERWQLVQGEVEVCLDKFDAAKGQSAKTKQRNAAIALLEAFLVELREVKVLDPACGTGNFLYVTMDLMKRLEDEVLGRLADITGVVQQRLGLDQVNPSQFLGIEINPRAAAIADLVIWIGYLQWHFRRYQDTQPQTPILRAFGNIECRDAVLAYDGVEPDVDAKTGEVRTRWGGGMMVHPVTGEEVPDPSDRRTIYRYLNARPAVWPVADYIVSNPPFLGNRTMREVLGDGYSEALRSCYQEVSSTVDYVMYWWHVSASLTADKKISRFGLITTNTISQTRQRSVIEYFSKYVSIFYAVPDHPWSNLGAAVRVAMTAAHSAKKKSRLSQIGQCSLVEDLEQFYIDLVDQINSDLRSGVDLSRAKSLLSNSKICSDGVKPYGAGFSVNHTNISGFPESEMEIVKKYINGKDITQKRRGISILDCFGLAEEDLRREYPFAYQWLTDNVKPSRIAQRDSKIRDNWWLFERNRPELRDAIKGLSRYIATVKTSKHRFFVFLDFDILPDQQIVAIPSQDACFLGILSSQVHVVWSLAAGGTLEDRPRYNNSVCFDPFPFPDPTEHQKQTIRTLGEQLDRHRKTVQATHPDITITGMYNLLEKIRAGQPLDDKDRQYNDRALVTTLKQIHDDLDRATFSAYGWDDLIPSWETQHTDPTAKEHLENQILERLVKLNAQRAEEERNGHIRWLRPDYQAPDRTATQTAIDDVDLPPDEAAIAPPEQQKWPTKLKDQIATIRDLLRTQGGEWTALQISAQFKGSAKGKTKQDAIAQTLEVLESLGLVRQDDRDGQTIWYAAELQQAA